jgi:hypothetical protein
MDIFHKPYTYVDGIVRFSELVCEMGSFLQWMPER